MTDFKEKMDKRYDRLAEILEDELDVSASDILSREIFYRLTGKGVSPRVAFALFTYLKTGLNQPDSAELFFTSRHAIKRNHGKAKAVLGDEEINNLRSKSDFKSYSKMEDGFDRSYSDEELLQSLREAAEKLDRLTVSALNDLQGFPCAATYQYRFGSWSSALKQIDYELSQKQLSRSNLGESCE